MKVAANWKKAVIRQAKAEWGGKVIENVDKSNLWAKLKGDEVRTCPSRHAVLQYGTNIDGNATYATSAAASWSCCDPSCWLKWTLWGAQVSHLSSDMV